LVAVFPFEVNSQAVHEHMTDAQQTSKNSLHDAHAPQAVGTVVLVGAGPGDAGLITVAGIEALRAADVVVFDALANPSLLKEAGPQAKMIDVGKRARAHKLTQDGINQLLVDQAQENALVVRLKGGDPYLFGRGAEEAAFCAKHGVACRIIPGVTSGIAAPAYAGIPVTHRQVASTLTFVTGHEDPTKDETSIDYDALAGLIKAGGTACFYMGVGRLPLIVDTLKQGGLTGQTGAALVQWGTRAMQKSVRGTLDTIVEVVDESGISSPAIIVIGPVVNVELPGLDWFTSRPLFGKKVLVTRTRQQASDLRTKLEAAGAQVLEAPTIELVPPPSWDEVDASIRSMNQRGFDWLILTSVNAVDTLKVRLDACELDARALAGIKIAVIGNKTAQAVEAMGIRPDLLPTRFVGESLAYEIIAKQTSGQRVLLLRADIARPQLPQLLIEAGNTVTEVVAYQTNIASGLPDEVWSALREGVVDWATFTSASTVTNLVQLLGQETGLLEQVKCASIGPITTEAMIEMGLSPTCEAARAGIEPLVQAVVDHA